MFSSWLKVSALSLTAALAAGCEIDAQSIHVDGSFDRTLTVSGPLDLDVLARSGQIEIHVGPQNAVHVVGHIRAYGGFRWLDGYSPEEQVKRLERQPPIEQSSQSIKIGDIWSEDSWYNDVSISYEITVPPDTRLRTTSRSGAQTIGAIHGPVTATSRSGRISIDHVGGDVDVETRSGDVDVVGLANGLHATSRSGRVTIDGQPARPWNVGTRSGDVDIQLQGDAAADLSVETRSGAISSNLPIQMSDIRSRKRLQGTIGRGGNRVSVSTRSGSVHIR